MPGAADEGQHDEGDPDDGDVHAGIAGQARGDAGRHAALEGAA